MSVSDASGGLLGCGGAGEVYGFLGGGRRGEKSRAGGWGEGVLSRAKQEARAEIFDGGVTARQGKVG